MEIQKTFYNYQKDFVREVERELRSRGVPFFAVIYEEFEKQQSEFREQKKKERKEGADKSIRDGVLWIIGGFFFSVISFSAADTFGWSSYVVAGGPVLYGIARIIDGFINKYQK